MTTRSRARRLLPLLTFITLGMILGSLLQLAFFRHLDGQPINFLRYEVPLLKKSQIRYLLIPDTVHLDNDQEAAVLRLGYVKPEVISWTPRIIVFHNFLSSEECDFLREIARPRLEISTVVDVATGKGVKSDVRTSSGMFVNSQERKFPVIQAVKPTFLRREMVNAVVEEGWSEDFVLSQTKEMPCSFGAWDSMVTQIRTAFTLGVLFWKGKNGRLRNG